MLDKSHRAKIADFGLAVDVKKIYHFHPSIPEEHGWKHPVVRGQYFQDIKKDIRGYGLTIWKMSSPDDSPPCSDFCGSLPIINTESVPPILKDIIQDVNRYAYDGSSDRDFELRCNLENIVRALNDYRVLRGEIVGVADVLAATVATMVMDDKK